MYMLKSTIMTQSHLKESDRNAKYGITPATNNI